ncbi:MAG: DNA cytosine methyltransferase [Pseudodesulfovibrio sp.]
MKAIDLFSGPGGLALGLKEAGIDPICSVEVSKDAADTYSSHTPDAIHYCEDIRKVDLAKHKTGVELVYGGPPCQPFSTGGLMKGAKDKRDMIPSFIEALKTIKPHAFIMENVPGLITKNKINYFHNALRKFSAIGYKLNWDILYSADYGVAQKRKRLIVLGCLDRLLLFPKPTHGPHGDNQYVPASYFLSKDTPIGTPPRSPVKYAQYPDLRKSPYAGHIYNGGGRPINLDEPCPTILASAGGYKTHWVDTLDVAPRYHQYLISGGNPHEGIVDGARRLSVEESALIQSFPRWLHFSGSRSSQYTQIGDAVPPKLAEAIGKAVVKQLDSSKIPIMEFLQPKLAQSQLEFPW